MKLALYFHRIVNDHDGDCSGDECEKECEKECKEESRGLCGMEVFVESKTLRKLEKTYGDEDNMEQLDPYDFFVEGHLFDYLQRKYGRSEKIKNRIGNCYNTSHRFERHTSNFFLKAVSVVDVLDRNWSARVYDSDSESV